MIDLNWKAMAILVAVAFVQNVSFTLVSRARNRDNMLAHAGASVFSNGVWFATMGILVKNEMSLALLPFYLLGTVPGSLWGAKVAIWLEARMGAVADRKTRDRLKEALDRVEKLECARWEDRLVIENLKNEAGIQKEGRSRDLQHFGELQTQLVRLAGQVRDFGQHVDRVSRQSAAQEEQLNAVRHLVAQKK